MSALVKVTELAKRFPAGRTSILRRPDSYVVAVDGVSLSIKAGETLGLVGESGCGKTTLARLILRLIPADAGRIEFLGEDITSARGEQLRRLRRHMQMVFQDPFDS